MGDFAFWTGPSFLESNGSCRLLSGFHGICGCPTQARAVERQGSCSSPFVRGVRLSPTILWPLDENQEKRGRKRSSNQITRPTAHCRAWKTRRPRPPTFLHRKASRCPLSRHLMNCGLTPQVIIILRLRRPVILILNRVNAVFKLRTCLGTIHSAKTGVGVECGGRG